MATDRLTNAYAGTGWTPAAFVNEDGTVGVSAEFLNAVEKVLGSGPGALAFDADKLATVTPTAVGLLALAAVSGTKVAGLAADTVPDYGIGVETPTSSMLTTNAHLDALTLGGNYAFYSASDGPDPGFGLSIVHTPVSSASANQVAISRRTIYPAIFCRSKTSGTWKAWSCISDGLNAGQPPAPRPSYSPVGGANSPGQVLVFGTQVGTGDIYYSGLTAYSGTWLLLVYAYVTATNVPVAFGFRIGSGASVWSNGAAANTYLLASWRLS